MKPSSRPLRDRVAQTGLEAGPGADLRGGFYPCSYGSVLGAGPGRHRRDQLLASRSYEWILEGDIKACFDAPTHCSFG